MDVKKMRILKQKTDSSVNKISMLDWGFFAIVGICAFLLFNHIDLLITAQHSYAYLQGNILDFYSACYKMNDTYSANYLPLTFALFAVWNIPLKLLGITPAYWGDWDVIFVMWNKLLPVSVFLISGWILYKLCSEELGIEKTKSRLIMYLFLTAPVAFFSQFLFCQYDVFTVFCMLIGLRYYYREMSRKNWIKFVLWFGLAVSFKYYAILALIALVFLKIKNIWKIFGSLGLAVCPSLVQFAVYYLSDREALINCIFGFGVLEYANTTGINIGFASIQLLPLFICLIGACAYFTKPRSKNEEISYGIFYCCGMFFALFSFMTWHPQWLLIAVPFWVIGACLNKKYEIMLWLDVLFFVVFMIFVVNVFRNAVDQDLLKNGILLSALQFSKKLNYTMADMLAYKETSMLFSVLTVLFAVFFIFNHPRFHMEDFSTELQHTSFVRKVRFVFCIALFSLLALSRLPDMLHAPELLWSQYDMEKTREVPLRMRDTVVQYATIPGDSITDVYVWTRTASDEVDKRQAMLMEVQDALSGEVITTSRLEGKQISKNGLSHFKVENCPVVPGKQYKIVFSSTAGYLEPVYINYGTGNQLESMLYNTVQRDYTEDYIEIDGQKYQGDDYHAIYQIYGHYHRK